MLSDDVSRGFPTHGRPKSTPPRKCDDGRERKRAKKDAKKEVPEEERTVRDAEEEERAYLRVRGRGRNRRED